MGYDHLLTGTMELSMQKSPSRDTGSQQLLDLLFTNKN